MYFLEKVTSSGILDSTFTITLLLIKSLSLVFSISYIINLLQNNKSVFRGSCQLFSLLSFFLGYLKLRLFTCLDLCSSSSAWILFNAYKQNSFINNLYVIFGQTPEFEIIFGVQARSDSDIIAE